MARQLTIVIKLGTSSIIDEKTRKPLISNLTRLASEIAELRKEGHRVILVSSGAVGLALYRTNTRNRPDSACKLRAIAAIGQCQLSILWERVFAHTHQVVAQVLLARNNFGDETQYLNTANTFQEILKIGAIPIVNENDTLSYGETKFDSNDTLSALVAGVLQANYLFLLTDVDCLYNKNPRTHPDAKPIWVVKNMKDLDADISGAGSPFGLGGMATKVMAAQLAASGGITTIISRASVPYKITATLKYLEMQRKLSREAFASNANPTEYVRSFDVPLHTCFIPHTPTAKDRRFWILSSLVPQGTIYIHKEASDVLMERAGLLLDDVVDCEGQFEKQSAVRVIVDTEDSTRIEMGRAVVSFSAAEIKKFKGWAEFGSHYFLGTGNNRCVAVRENLALS